MRLYYGRLLKAMNHVQGDKFHLTLIRDHRIHGNYEGTIEEIIEQVKADGHHVFGKDVLDYACHPHNAWEYSVIKELLGLRGHDDADIRRVMELRETDDGE